MRRSTYKHYYFLGNDLIFFRNVFRLTNDETHTHTQVSKHINLEGKIMRVDMTVRKTGQETREPAWGTMHRREGRERVCACSSEGK